jgi:putative ABC transport system permease protein
VVTQLHAGGRNSVGARDAGRARQILVGVEMTLATVMLASAGLLLHSFVKVMTTDRGYDVDRILAVELSLFGQRYSSGEARTAFYNDLLESVRALPRVAAAGAVSHLPALSVSDGASQTVFHSTDTDFKKLVMTRPVALIRSATAGYFQASGVPLLAGRLLTDQEPAPVAVISASLASLLWPGEQPGAILNRRFRQGNTTGPLIEVVGVVTDARSGSLEGEPPPVIYRPYPQWASGPMTVVVRAAQDPASLGLDVRATIRRLDQNLPIASMRTLREIVSTTVAPRRFQMTLMTLFAVVALILGAVGTYGVVSYGVVCRTREVGLRIALGARRADVLQWVLLAGLRPVLVGVAAGLIAAIAAASAMRGMLFGVTPLDPLSLGVVATVLVLTAALACYLPARRAARLDPIVALRHD